MRAAGETAMLYRSPVRIHKRQRLSLRARIRMHDEHGAKCIVCPYPILPGERFIDEHDLPLAMGGDNSRENRGPAHIVCARIKTKQDLRDIARADRVRAKDLGIKLRKGRPIQGGRNDHRKKTFYRGVVDRVTGEPWQGRR